MTIAILPTGMTIAILPIGKTESKNDPREEWHPWIECKTTFDYKNLAEAFIPQSNKDSENYWRNAARTLFCSVLEETNGDQKTSDLQKWLLLEPLKSLAKFVSGTKAASHIDMSSDKTAASIRSVASTFLECLENIKDTKTPFSICGWMEKEDDSWLFLQCNPAQRAAMKP